MLLQEECKLIDKLFVDLRENTFSGCVILNQSGSVRDDLFFFGGDTLFFGGRELLKSSSPSRGTHQQHTMGQGPSQDPGECAEKRDPTPPNEKGNGQASEKPKKRNKGKKKTRHSTTGNTVQTNNPNEVARPSLRPSLSAVS